MSLTVLIFREDFGTNMKCKPNFIIGSLSEKEEGAYSLLLFIILCKHYKKFQKRKREEASARARPTFRMFCKYLIRFQKKKQFMFSIQNTVAQKLSNLAPIDLVLLEHFQIRLHLSNINQNSDLKDVQFLFWVTVIVFETRKETISLHQNLFTNFIEKRILSL